MTTISKGIENEFIVHMQVTDIYVATIQMNSSWRTIYFLQDSWKILQETGVSSKSVSWAGMRGFYNPPSFKVGHSKPTWAPSRERSSTLAESSFRLMDARFWLADEDFTC